MKKVKVVFKGKVQGVFFRDNTRKKAEELDIRGYVTNLSNDDVEAVFIGEDHKVEEIIKYCRNGPGIAKVEDMMIEDYEDKEFYDFKIRFL